MWVTQSYLGDVEPDAKVFVYYLYEAYDTEQADFTRAVQSKLEELGAQHKGRVSLLMPNERFAASINGELREKVEGLWWELKGKLPALLICTRPLRDFDQKSGDYFVVPFPLTTAEAAEAAAVTVRRMVDDLLQREFTNRESATPESIWQRFYASLELKPGYAGFRIDLKKLFDRGR